MDTVAIGIFCKTPTPGLSKTRLSPPLQPDQCATLSACFIRDLAATIADVARSGGAVGCAVYTPIGSEPALRELLPPGFRLLPQCEGDFGVRIAAATRELLRRHSGAILVNADSPTLPPEILREALAATRDGASVVLSPALDGGYTLIGVSDFHSRLYEDVPWSTATVFDTTLDRAAEINLPVTTVPGWYDVDDAASLAVLESELAGQAPFEAAIAGAKAPATKAYLASRALPLIKSTR